MVRFLLLTCLFISCIGFSQKRKKQVVSYKTIHDTRFSIGDRISLGEIKVVALPKGKDSIQIPDSLEGYRQFVQRNHLMTFKVHLIWKNQGVKYPDRSKRTAESLLNYLNEDGPDENGSWDDSTCYIYGFKHTFVKQEPLLRIELEVIHVQSMNLSLPVDEGMIHPLKFQNSAEKLILLTDIKPPLPSSIFYVHQQLTYCFRNEILQIIHSFVSLTAC